MEFHPTSKPPTSFDVFLDSMIGRAFLEWNSTIGVTVEAWRVLSTSQAVFVRRCARWMVTVLIETIGVSHFVIMWGWGECLSLSLVKMRTRMPQLTKAKVVHMMTFKLHA
jgi:hypothetical protein